VYRLARPAPGPRLCASLVAGLLLCLPAPAVTQAGPGGDGRVEARECCLQLLTPIGARAVGLGHALTARPGPDAIFSNPAALAGLQRDEFRIHNAETEIEASNTFALAFGLRAVGTFGLSYRLLDYGESEATDDVGNPTGKIRVLAHVLMGSFATTMAPGLAAGVSYKVFQFRQDCVGFCGTPGFVATTHAVDLGVQYHPQLWPALQLGAAVTQLGLPLQVINAEQADPLPSRFRAGAAYELLHHFASDTTTAVWASVDVAGSWRDGVQSVVGAGLELILDGTIFVRAGYSTGTGQYAGAAVGVGLRHDRFDVGVAKSFVSSGIGGPAPFQITFAVGF
jgi:hypothetical protein